MSTSSTRKSTKGQTEGHNIPEIYSPVNKVRIVTAASLFDGHDAAINIMRRILQSSGAEIIHLGHNRSALEVVDTAIQEDAQGIAITSYQGGHIEYFKYIHDLLKERGASHIRIFGGGGGTILPSEIDELQAYGITRIYSPDDGRKMGLQGMINDLLEKCDFALGIGEDLLSLTSGRNQRRGRGSGREFVSVSLAGSQTVGRGPQRCPLVFGGEPLDGLAQEYRKSGPKREVRAEDVESQV